MDRKLKSAALALILLLSTTIIRADDNLLIGTWKLKSFVREILATGERYNQLGEHPDGYLSYSSDGRMYVIITADNRIKPREEIESGKVTHHIDISWNGARIGTDQVRFYTLDEDILTIKTAPNKSPVDGREGVGILVWEKVKAPAQ
jgi:hypothetical protein